MCNITTNEYKKIVIEEIPLIDVRAPIEYNKGAFLNSANLPLMNDQERHLVGICYKEQGNEAAMKLGHKLVSDEIRKSRIKAWTSYLNEHPEGIIYCFRGGSRSQISQQWIAETLGKDFPRLEGGYKAFRNYLLNALEPAEQISKPIILGGYTGSGKTIFLKEFDNFINLENIANHRGSSFGQHIMPQPTQINFENNLAYALIQHKHKEHKYMLLEDEGRHVGKCFVPQALVEFFNNGLLVILDVPFEERIQNTLTEYVIEAQEEYIEEFGTELGLLEWFKYINNSINKLQKRLGGECHQRIIDSIECAFKEQLLTGDYKLHENWIEILLKEYYDPMYLYQIQNKANRISFTGNQKEITTYLNSL